MRFETMIEGMPVVIDIAVYAKPEKIIYRWGGNIYDSYERVLAAIKAADLAARKGFSNSTAYRIYGEQLEELTVTSICEGGTDAWVRKPDGSREKLALGYLLADKEEAQRALERWLALRAEADEVLPAVRRWAPEWEGGNHG